MNVIHPIAETGDTITLRRVDFKRLLDAAEDADDVTALVAAAAREEALGQGEARTDHLPGGLVVRLIAGEHPVRIWREHRGLLPQELADRAGVSRSYLVEIETGRKPGSVSAYRKLSAALGVQVDDLLPDDDTR